MEEKRADAEKGRIPEARADAPEAPIAPDTAVPETPEAVPPAAAETPSPAPAAPAATGACDPEPARDRKVHRTIVLGIVAFALLLTGASIAYSMLAPEAEKSDLVAEPSYKDAAGAPERGPGSGGAGAGAADAANPEAPDFTAVDADGREVTLADFRGRPVVLNFWASWCGPCRSEMPAFQAAFRDHGNDAQFLIVNMTGMNGESRETAMRLIEAKGYTFPVFFDKNGSAARAYGVSSIPQTWFIDADGTVAARAMGALSEAKLQQGIELITQ